MFPVKCSLAESGIKLEVIQVKNQKFYLSGAFNVFGYFGKDRFPRPLNKHDSDSTEKKFGRCKLM